MVLRGGVAAVVLGAAWACAAGQGAVSYHMTKQIPVGREGGQDYLNIDQEGRRLYVSHGTTVEVVDIDKDVWVGTISGLNGVHGIAVAPKFGHGFITSGKTSTVRMFDLKTLATLADAPAAGTPDGVVYEPMTERVLAFDHRSGVVTAVDAKSGAVVGMLEIGGMPEFPATDGKGTVWVNQEDKSTLFKIDAKTMKVLGSWPVAPCEGPTGMDLDRANRRLFIGCGNERMAVVNADTGAVITTLPIGVHTDATWFDPGTKLIFNANRGTTTVIRQSGPDTYSVVQSWVPAGHANTLAIDFKTHRVFQASSLYESTPGADGAAAKVSVVPGSFAVQVWAQ
ncbi:MAG: YncE family protein [Acidobacteriota bacterium]|nr:YncE family protein [Acidobacteriota bacterium]